MSHVIVVYASRHGATREIAQRVAAVLADRGCHASVIQAQEAPDPASADAVILGSAAYMGKWLDEATTYLRTHRKALRARPTWLFSSGPVGTDLVDKQGHDVLDPPAFLVELAESIGARGTKVFFGRWDPDDTPASVAERLFRMLPISKELLPIGDYRDWTAIEEWAAGIAGELVGETGALPVG
jgi:menaquinone-dependent protoporphyrinogen oxidase